MSARHCSKCGRLMVETLERDGFNQDASRKMHRWVTCPRFWRSWRNLWMGGCHDSASLDVPMLGREYR